LIPTSFDADSVAREHHADGATDTAVAARNEHGLALQQVRTRKAWLEIRLGIISFARPGKARPEADVPFVVSSLAGRNLTEPMSPRMRMLLYVSVSSSCNACIDGNPENATKPEGSTLRNTIGLAFQRGIGELPGRNAAPNSRAPAPSRQQRGQMLLGSP
jgi:hypothetical protein